MLAFLIFGLALFLVWAGVRRRPVSPAVFERAGWVTAALGLLSMPYLWRLVYPELMIVVGLAIAISGRRQRARSRFAR